MRGGRAGGLPADVWNNLALARASIGAMEASPFRERRLAPTDVRRIVKRAAELAEKDPSTAAAEQSLTQDEIERLGAQLGLSDQVVRRAISEDAGGAATDPTEATGTRRIYFEDDLDGELPLDRHEDVVDAVQGLMGETGTAQVVGRTLTWAPAGAPNNGQRQLSVSVRSRDGRTRLRIDEKLHAIFWACWLGFGLGLSVPAVGLGVAVGKAAESKGLAVAMIFFFIGLTLMLAHLVFTAVSRRRRRELSQLRNRLVGVVRAAVQRAPAAATSSPAAVRPAAGGARIATAETAAAELEAQAEEEAGGMARGQSA